MGSPYVFEYDRSFGFDVERATMWDALHRTERYETWWEWMRDLNVHGRPLSPGTRFSFAVVAPIPFSMRLTVEVTDVVPERSVSASIHGDLSGIATMRFEDAPEGCRAHISWRVELRQKAMRAAALVAHPVLAWGQEWAVGAALRGFNRDLAATR